jgi:hypothetical protein
MTSWLSKTLALALSWVMVALPLHVPAQDKPIPSHCQVAMAGLTGDGRDYYDNFVFTHVPQPAAVIASASLPNSVSTLVAAPTTAAEYRNIFLPTSRSGSPPAQLTQAQVSELSSFQASLKQTLGRDHPDNLSKTSIEAQIKADRSAFVVVVGHNDKGRFRFADGTQTTIDSMAEAARPDQRLIFISCEAAKHLTQPNAVGVHRELTYPEAFQIAKNIETYIAGIPAGLSVNAVKQRLESAESSIGVKYQVKYFLMQAACTAGTLIVVALIISLLDPCLHKDKC